MKKTTAALLSAGLLVAACAPASKATSPSKPEPIASTTTTAKTDACGPIAKSECTPANEGSVIRGVVHFDPARFVGKKPPLLRVFLHHQFQLQKDEGRKGGHPHAYASYKDVDMKKGEAHFSMDLCMFGHAMWTEENCGFNLVALLDEEGTHDPDANGEEALVPKKGELMKMTPLEVSCHRPSTCVELTLDCIGGEDCVKYDAPKSCACAADSCPSDSKICMLKQAHPK